MKAIVCPKLGDPSVLVLEEREPARPEPDQVRVALHGGGVNFSDLLMLSGHYQEKLVPPFVPGTEGAGVVVECGSEVTGFRPGDRVLVQNNATRGCFADEVVAHWTRLAVIPAELDFVRAAGFAIAYGTAYHALVDRGQLKSGETLLVHGASGGVGVAAVQLGRALGAKVIATGGNDEKLAVVKGHGADHVINYRNERFRDRTLELTDGRGVDVVYDPVGGDIFDESMRAMAPEGRLIVIGFAGGRIPSAPANRILFKEISVVGAAYGPFTARAHARWAANMETLFNLVRAGTLVPFVHRTYGLEDAALALASVARREVIGKYVLLTERGRDAQTAT